MSIDGNVFAGEGKAVQRQCAFIVVSISAAAVALDDVAVFVDGLAAEYAISADLNVIVIFNLDILFIGG